jgi:glyoxylase I family protein
MRVSSAVGACVLVVVSSLSSLAQSPAPAAPSSPTKGTAMERVTGIGGVFFRASDPKALSDWYERHLGVARTPASYAEEPWRQEAGITIFAPFSADTKYFGRTTQQWMINFRVRDLAAMVAQLRGAGIAVEIDAEVYPNGRFARLHDPEGNPIQLWEERIPPKAATPDR